MFLPIVDSTVRLANLQSGGLDLIERVAATDVDTVKRDGRLKLGEITGLGYIGITTNLNNGPRSVCGPCAEAPASIAENSSANPAHSHLHNIIVPSPVDAGDQLRTSLNPLSVGKKDRALPHIDPGEDTGDAIGRQSCQVCRISVVVADAYGRREGQQETRERPCLSPSDFMVVRMPNVGST